MVKAIKWLCGMAIIGGSLNCGDQQPFIQVDQQDPARPVIQVNLSPKEAKFLSKNLNYKTGKQVLAVYMYREQQIASTPLLGEYTLQDRQLTFTPQNDLGAGLTFKAQYYHHGDTIRQRFTIPEASLSEAPSPEVEQIFPLSDHIPQNILIFHIRFNQTMREDEKAFRHVRIIDEQGNEEPFIYTWRNRSYWLDSNRVLVLMVHPGRVKRGIRFKKAELGELFTLGDTYSLVVLPELKDKYGRPLERSYSRNFTIIPPDRKVPEIHFSAFQLPTAQTHEPLVLVFSEGMDYASIIDGIEIYEQATGKSLSGNFQYTHSDSIWHFVPTRAWKHQRYELQFGKVVADFAHNRLHRPFEAQDLKGKDASAIQRTWKFTPGL